MHNPDAKSLSWGNKMINSTTHDIKNLCNGKSTSVSSLSGPLRPVIAESADQMRFKTSLSPDDVVFRGHYPHAPIFPGVLLLELMEHACRAYMKEKYKTLLKLREVRRIRFLSAVFPGYDLEVRGAHRVSDGGYAFDVEIFSAAGVAARAALNFEAVHHAS